MPPSPTKSSHLLIFIGASLLLAALSVHLFHKDAEPSLAAPVTPAPGPSPASAAPAPAPKAPSPTAIAVSRLRDANDSLIHILDSIAARKRLAELRAELAAMPKEEAVAAIRQFLDSKADTPTHLGFKIGGGGLLDDAPTLRVFLLDELGRIDPGAAADYAKVILDGMGSPDEWAVALRDLANGDSSADGRALLQEKTAQMLQYAPWQQNPSTGYLEAFDVAVYLGGTDLLPVLSGMVRQQNDPAIAHASYLALDRLVINNPATELAALEASPDTMQGRESTRADYFARADVRDPQQLQVLESYLLNPAISTSELQTFAGIFPNANYMISANLLTPTPTPDRQSLTSRDAQSMVVAQQWLADPRFAKLTPVLQTIISRLQMFAQQASQGQ